MIYLHVTVSLALQALHVFVVTVDMIPTRQPGQPGLQDRPVLVAPFLDPSDEIICRSRLTYLTIQVL